MVRKNVGAARRDRQRHLKDTPWDIARMSRANRVLRTLDGEGDEEMMRRMKCRVSYYPRLVFDARTLCKPLENGRRPPRFEGHPKAVRRYANRVNRQFAKAQASFYIGPVDLRDFARPQNPPDVDGTTPKKESPKTPQQFLERAMRIQNSMYNKVARRQVGCVTVTADHLKVCRPVSVQ